MTKQWRPKGWKNPHTPSFGGEPAAVCPSETYLAYEAGADAGIKAVLDSMPPREEFKLRIIGAIHGSLEMADLEEWIYKEFRGKFE